MTRTHDAWLVDLDGTLYKATPVKLAMAVELVLFGATRALLLRRFRQEHEHIRDLDVEGDPFRLQIERTAEATGRPADHIERIVRSWMIERPARWLGLFRRKSLLQEVADFRAAGGRTAVVSDYPARRKLEALAASHLFDVVVASGEPGGPVRLKPHPSGMLRAAEALGIAPDRCLVIGDRTDADGLAAKSAGMDFRLMR